MRRLRLRILFARDTSRFACGTALALCAENAPPEPFLNAQTFSGSNPVKNKEQAQKYLFFAWLGWQDSNPPFEFLNT